MTTRPTSVLEQTRYRCATPNTNLLKGLVIVQGNIQRLDRDFLTAIITFPYIGNGTITHSGDFIRYDVLSRDFVVGRKGKGAEDLQSWFHRWTKGRKGEHALY